MKSKALLLLLPVAVLGLVLFRYDAETPDTPATGDDAARPPAVPVGLPAPGIDWATIASQTNAGGLSGRIDESSDYGRFLKQMEAMTGPQLIAAAEELAAAADLPEESRQRLGIQLLGTLVRKDAELALAHHAHRLRDAAGDTGALLLEGFRQWAKKFPTKAEIWLDARIQAGDLEGEAEETDMPARMIYERELIRSLLVARPEQVAARLDALPESWRAKTLAGTDTAPSQGAYAALVRRYFPAAEQQAEFVRMASSTRYLEGEDGVARLLDQIAATPDEREAIKQALRSAR